MISKNIFLIVLSLLTLITLTGNDALARRRHKKHDEKPSAPYKYYYLMPVDASADWTYTVPDCIEVSKSEYHFLSQKDKCQKNAETRTETCLSRADTELKNSKTKEKKKFGLNYVIHDTKQACEDARAKLVARTAAPTADAKSASAAPSAPSTPSATPAGQP